MKILLTGISGFAGSLIAEDLLKNDHQVVGVYRRNLPESVATLGQTFECDCVQADLSEACELPADIDGIIHMAAEARPCGVSVHGYLRDNVLATHNLIKFALDSGIDTFVNFSTCSVYGDIVDTVVTEKTPLMNPLPYGMTKHMAEIMLDEVKESIASISLRVPGIVGRGESSCWVANVAKRMMRGEDIPFFNGKELFNNVVHALDISSFLQGWIVKEHAGADVVNFAASQPMSIIDVLHFLKKKLYYQGQMLEKECVHSSHIISCEKFCEKYGYEPMSVKDTLLQYMQDLMGSNKSTI